MLLLFNLLSWIPGLVEFEFPKGIRDGLVICNELAEGDAVEIDLPGESVDGDVPRTPSFSRSPELELEPILANDTLPLRRSLLVEGVPGVAGVRPPLEGVRLVPGVPGVLDLLFGVPGVLGVLPGVPGVRLGVDPGVLLLLWPPALRLCIAFCSMSLD